MSDQTSGFSEQAADFQKIWVESLTKLMQTAFTLRPDAASPELLRQIRNGILQALSESWDQFLRSPQFQEGMKQWMEQAVAFRKMSNEMMVKFRRELQAPSRDDVDAIMLAVRHMETRVLDRMEEIEKRVAQLNHNSGKPKVQKRAAAGAARKRMTRKAKK